jgi:hypothetical protein
MASGEDTSMCRVCCAAHKITEKHDAGALLAVLKEVEVELLGKVPEELHGTLRSVLEDALKRYMPAAGAGAGAAAVAGGADADAVAASPEATYYWPAFPDGLPIV